MTLIYFIAYRRVMTLCYDFDILYCLPSCYDFVL